MSERDLTVDRLERNLSSLQDKMKATMMENTTLKDRLRKIGFLQEESGRLTAPLNERTKELKEVVAERDQLKNSLELTQAQVSDCSHPICISRTCILTMQHGVLGFYYEQNTCSSTNQFGVNSETITILSMCSITVSTNN